MVLDSGSVPANFRSMLKRSHVMAAMSEVDATADLDSAESVTAEPEKIPQQFQELLDKYPSLLKTEFSAKSKGKPVIHYIHTKGKPCTAKMRPLMKGSPKEVMATLTPASLDNSMNLETFAGSKALALSFLVLL